MEAVYTPASCRPRFLWTVPVEKHLPCIVSSPLAKSQVLLVKMRKPFKCKNLLPIRRQNCQGEGAK